MGITIGLLIPLHEERHVAATAEVIAWLRYRLCSDDGIRRGDGIKQIILWQTSLQLSVFLPLLQQYRKDIL